MSCQSGCFLLASHCKIILAVKLPGLRCWVISSYGIDQIALQLHSYKPRPIQDLSGLTSAYGQLLSTCQEREFIWEFWAKFPQDYFSRWFLTFIMQAERHVKISSVQLKQSTITQTFVPTSSRIGHFIKNCILTYFISTCKLLGNI